MACIFISAAHKSSGKTTVSVGLGAALTNRGLSVQPFKKGPDYIDPMWLSAATGRACHSLDFHTMTDDVIRNDYARHAADADLALIEGNKGLFDGLDLDGGNSNAAMASFLDTPVILVIDARGMTRGIAPLILGYQAFGPEVRIQGVILNNIGGSRHEAKLRRIVEHYTDVEVLGAVQRDSSLGIEERHMGLIPDIETPDKLTIIRAAANAIKSQVNLERVVEIAATAKLPPIPPPGPANVKADLTIGYALDSAFGFYYPGDLDALRAAGAKLVPINMMTASRLPDIDGLIIGGGFPETHMTELEANTSMRNEVREAIDSGMPCYAECGGMIYLARRLSWNGKTSEMAGVIAADVTIHEKPQGRGYVKLMSTGQSPWPLPTLVPAHEFHYASLDNVPENTVFAYQVMRGTGIDGKHDGIVHKNLLASFCHLRSTASTPWAAGFTDFVRNHKNTNP